MTEPQDPAPAAHEEAEAERESASEPEATPPVEPKKTSRFRLKWWWFLIAALLIEFWLYGRRGHIEVCVGKNGETDFALVGQERTDENRWKFPRCEERLNLGLKSHFDDATKESIAVACRGATIFHHQGESKACVAADKGWIHRIDVGHCPPWHEHFVEHLFWFLR
jgi:hypothetical protein